MYLHIRHSHAGTNLYWKNKWQCIKCAVLVHFDWNNFAILCMNHMLEPKLNSISVYPVLPYVFSNWKIENFNAVYSAFNDKCNNLNSIRNKILLSIFSRLFTTIYVKRSKEELFSPRDLRVGDEDPSTIFDLSYSIFHYLIYDGWSDTKCILPFLREEPFHYWASCVLFIFNAEKLGYFLHEVFSCVRLHSTTCHFQSYKPSYFLMFPVGLWYVPCTYTIFFNFI